jgi:putative DNA primase/helicase
MEMRGKWIIEMSELPNLRGVALERFKAFITSRFDRFREPYGRRVSEHPRQCVLAASTNSTEPFIDPTGTRRIWPVECTDINLDLIEHDADQLLAEAYVRFCNGEKWWLETAELEALATAAQDERYEPGVWDEIILDWIENPERRETLESQTHIPVTPWDASEPRKVTINDILIHGIGKDADRLTQADYKQVARCLEHAKWKRKQDRSRGPHRGKRFDSPTQAD